MVSVELFYQRMFEYNSDMWPVMIFTYVLAVLVIILSIKRFKFSDTIITSVLGFLWIWNGLIEFIIYFGSVSAQYYAWGSLWILQGVLFIWFGIMKANFIFKIGKDIYSITGLIIILFALVVYPIIGFLTDHGYPHGPIFGIAPCPVCIFTFGILLFNNKKLPLFILVLPFLWSLTGLYAGFKMEVYQDFGEAASGIIGVLLIYLRNKKLFEESE